jgi:asparagine synthase (glutamine-hydrolysing)
VCGIAGIINPRAGVDRSVLEKASSWMAHRGPDDEGLFIEGQAGLLHRRLSIIDLTGGAQPMFNQDKKIVVVFNGEIYNFMELRYELESKGHTAQLRRMGLRLRRKILRHVCLCHLQS